MYQSDGTFRLYSNPTIGEIRSLRRKGAIILHLMASRVDRVWVTDTGVPVIVYSIPL